MSVATGVIDKIYKDMRKTRYGEKEATTFVIDGVKYSGGFKNYNAISEGQVVTVTFDENGAYKNVTNLSLASPAATSSMPARRGGRMAGEEGGFPLHPLAYERALDRRNALNAAVTLCVEAAKETDNPSLLNSTEVILCAKQFEAYTTGDLEREAAEKEFEAEKPDPYNF